MKPTMKAFEAYVASQPSHLDPVDLFWEWITGYDLDADGEEEAYQMIFRRSVYSGEVTPF
jgi:hypothetical protein